jgi:hypothetical protein
VFAECALHAAGTVGADGSEEGASRTSQNGDHP